MIRLVHVPEKDIQNKLAQALQSEFSHDYLVGYFESTVWPNGQIYIIDYNRLLEKHIPAPNSLNRIEDFSGGRLSGRSAHPGKVKGMARIVKAERINESDFPEGAILVCENTDVRFLPMMKKADAIVTDKGGILSHAAIIARELKKPCIIDTKNATEVLKDGDQIEVDATKGVVKKL